MFAWEASRWLGSDPPGDYASDIPFLGVPVFLGSIANLVGVLLVFLMMRRRAVEDYHLSARRCFQWMQVYLCMHGAIHMSWGYMFRVPFTAAMNIAFAFMRHYGFSLSWQRAAPEKAEKGRRISEALVCLLVVFNLIVVSPRALTIGITSIVQPLLLWPLRFWVDDWRRPRHLAWLVGFSAMWWIFSFFSS